MGLKKMIIFLFLFTFSLDSYSQYHSKFIEDSVNKIMAYDSLIVWDENRKLTAEDFQGIPDDKSTASAITASVLIPILQIDSILHVEVVCAFDRRMSWAKRFALNPYALRHEQGHFDIAQAFAKKMTKQLSELTISDENINGKIAQIYEAIYKDMDDMQNEYDKDTSGKYDTIEQQKWLRRISSLLY